MTSNGSRESSVSSDQRQNDIIMSPRVKLRKLADGTVIKIDKLIKKFNKFTNYIAFVKYDSWTKSDLVENL